MINSIITYISDNFSSIVQAGLILIFTIFLAKVVSLLITENMRFASKKLGHRFTVKRVTKIKLIRRLVVAAIYFIGLAAFLYQFQTFRRLGGIMFASAGILGIIFGIAAQASLANIFAGLMISFTQPVRLGDFIEIDGQEGRVEDITLTYTRIRTWDNKRLIIPNKQFFDSKIINYSLVDNNSLMSIVLTLSSDLDLDLVKKKIITEIKKSKLNLLKKEPKVLLIELSSDQIKIEVQAWSEKPEKIWDFSCEIRERLLKLLKSEGWLKK